MDKNILALILSIVLVTMILIVFIFAIYEYYTSNIKKLKKSDLVKEFENKIDKEETCINIPCRPIIYQYFDANNLFYHEKQDPSIAVKKINRFYKIKERKSFLSVLNSILNVLLVIILLAGATFGIYLKATGSRLNINGNTYVTIASGSMSFKNEHNLYLDEHELNDQIETFSFVELKKVQSKNDIKLYGIYAYEDDDGDLIVHRIIKEEKREDGVYYTFRGDANSKSDYFLIKDTDVLFEYTGYKNVPLGFAISFVNSILGIISIIEVIIVLSVLDTYSAKYKKVYDKLLDSHIKVLNDYEEGKIGIN